MTGHPLPPELAARVRAELEPGEQLVWTGQPRLDLIGHRALPLTFFGVVFTVVSLVMTFMVGNTFGGPETLCPLFFVAIGVAMMCAPLWAQSKARGAVYALTDRRALIWEPQTFGGTTLYTYAPSGLGKIARTERGDGSGDLVFEEVTSFSGSGSNARTYTTQRGFLAIDRVREVHELLRKTLLDRA